jgi:hypothetical protein
MQKLLLEHETLATQFVLSMPAGEDHDVPL